MSDRDSRADRFTRDRESLRARIASQSPSRRGASPSPTRKPRTVGRVVGGAVVPAAAPTPAVEETKSSMDGII